MQYLLRSGYGLCREISENGGIEPIALGLSEQVSTAHLVRVNIALRPSAL